MPCPKPVISDYCGVEMSILEPVIAGWIEDPLQQTLSDFRDCIEMQIIRLQYDIIINQFSVQISDGLHFINAKLDRSLNIKVNEGLLDHCDIVKIEKSLGHPASFSVDLVSMFL